MADRRSFLAALVGAVAGGVVPRVAGASTAAPADEGLEEFRRRVQAVVDRVVPGATVTHCTWRGWLRSGRRDLDMHQAKVFLPEPHWVEVDVGHFVGHSYEPASIGVREGTSFESYVEQRLRAAMETDESRRSRILNQLGRLSGMTVRHAKATLEIAANGDLTLFNAAGAGILTRGYYIQVVGKPVVGKSPYPGPFAELLEDADAERAEAVAT